MLDSEGEVLDHAKFPPDLRWGEIDSGMTIRYIEEEAMAMKSKNANTLASFTKYCKKHPGERFWQALRNWSEYKFIEGSKNGVVFEDTFYKEEGDWSPLCRFLSVITRGGGR